MKTTKQFPTYSSRSKSTNSDTKHIATAFGHIHREWRAISLCKKAELSTFPGRSIRYAICGGENGRETFMSSNLDLAPTVRQRNGTEVPKLGDFEKTCTDASFS